MDKMFRKCNSCNKKSSITKPKTGPNRGKSLLQNIPIKFPSGLQATQLTDMDESLTILACKRLSIIILTDVFCQNHRIPEIPSESINLILVQEHLKEEGTG